MALVELTFWLSVGCIAYAYFGYPVLLWLISTVRSHSVQKGETTPPVTFIITAYNEAARIDDKLENTLRLSYPRELLEILVASDCSTDGTDALVMRYAGKGVRLVRADRRKGKEAAQKLAVAEAKGEVLIFSDVATILEPDAIRNIVRSFSDSTVGCVSSEDRFLDIDGKMSGEGAYVKYEMFLRSLESRVNSLVGLSGSFFAARAVVCHKEWSEDLQSDFNTVLSSMRAGFRGVIDPDSVGYYKNLRDERREYERKVRTVLRGISVFMRSLTLVNPFRYPLFAWQLISHKLCRWLVPFGMMAAFGSCAGLAWSDPFYRVLLGIQLAFYMVAVSGLLWKPLTHSVLVRIPSFFVMVNASILQAWWRYIRGERVVAWEPSRRWAG